VSDRARVIKMLRDAADGIEALKNKLTSSDT